MIILMEVLHFYSKFGSIKPFYGYKENEPSCKIKIEEVLFSAKKCVIT